MTKVNLPRQRSSSSALSGGRQTPQTSSDGNFTPVFSTPGPRIGQTAVPSTQFTFRISPDTALPSIESPSADKQVQSPSNTSTPSTPVPLLSVSSSKSTPTPMSIPTTEGVTSGSILDDQLETLRLWSTPPGINMGQILDALNAVEAGRDSRSRSLNILGSPSPTSLSSRRQRIHSRRSSSQTNLAKHDVREEALPNDRFNMPAIQTALRDTKELMSKLVDVLGSSTVHNEPDSVMARLLRRTEALAEFKSPPTRTVGFVGDTGTGKSSLINSLLDLQELVRSSNSDTACTCVVTEFYFHEHEAFNITVEAFSEKELISQLENLLQDFRHFRLNRDSSVSCNVKKRFGIARDTFQAMFHSRLSDEGVLLEGTESQALSTVRSWLQDYNSRPMLESKNTGLSLSLRDKNLARRNITERYLLRCDDIFVVSPGSRIASNKGIPSVIELAKQARLSNIGIICTRSDEVKESEAQKDWKGQEASDHIRTKRERINLLKSEAATLDFIKQVDEEEFNLRKFIITTRNSIIKRNLSGLYAHEVPGNSLRVFCASNTMYWDCRDEPKTRAMPHLILSGILEIREHCMSIVSESQYKAATEYMRDGVGVLLGDLDLWVQSGQGSLDATRKAEIRSTLDTLERRLHQELCAHTSKLNGKAVSYKSEFNTVVYQPHRNHLDEWRTAAKRASQDWNGLSHATYSAFCRSYGFHLAPAVGPRSWNRELIEKMTKDLSPAWTRLLSSLEDQDDDIIDSIDTLFDWAGGLLDTNLDDSRDTATSIRSTLSSRERLLKAEIKTHLDNFQNDLQALQTDALSDIRTSFIGRHMETAYNKARCESGQGSDSRRKSIITSAVSHDRLFSSMLKSFETDFYEYVDKNHDLIRKAARSHFKAIQNTFDIVRGENAASESERNPEFRMRVEARLRVTREEMERVYSLIAV
ncbi:hypothetical protein O1611_g5007 [Lasiodiplodia mahajangana]|uniref:Uncharacterized protein n=1 Tax=Lasiodiplodia mahajangana TaxID=1108764 RepID=A0ACC2JMC8_9PEZI|nr:hypothetical protein O1611_g5007 [Lasiodiplodia mahajangana]